MKPVHTLILASLLAPLALAGHSMGRCDSDGDLALGILEVTGGSADTTFYVDDRNWVSGNGIWTYQETNGIWSEKAPGVYTAAVAHADLQRGGGSPWVPSDGEICVDDPNVIPDSLIL